MPDRILDDAQIESFLEHGHVVVRDCFDRAAARPWLEAAWMRLAQSWMRRAGLGSDDAGCRGTSEGEPGR